jgi:hypothetical protein
MNRKDVLLEQFLCCQKKSHWFVSFEKAVAGLTPEQANWKRLIPRILFGKLLAI